VEEVEKVEEVKVPKSSSPKSTGGLREAGLIAEFHLEQSRGTYRMLRELYFC
jgi:hypothetical protein